MKWKGLSDTLINSWPELVLVHPSYRNSCLQGTTQHQVITKYDVRYPYTAKLYNNHDMAYNIVRREMSCSLMKMKNLRKINVVWGQSPVTLTDYLLKANALTLECIQVMFPNAIPNITFPRLKRLMISCSYIFGPNLTCPSLRQLVIPHIGSYYVNSAGFNKLKYFLEKHDLESLTRLHFRMPQPAMHRIMNDHRMILLFTHVLSRISNVRSLILNVSHVTPELGGMALLVDTLQDALMRMNNLEILAIQYQKPYGVNHEILEFHAGFFTKLINQNQNLRRLLLHDCRISAVDIMTMQARNLANENHYHVV